MPINRPPVGVLVMVISAGMLTGPRRQTRRSLPALSRRMDCNSGHGLAKRFDSASVSHLCCSFTRRNSMIAHFATAAALTLIGPQLETARVTPTKATPASVSLAITLTEQNIIAHTNAQRQRYGLPPLTLDPALLKSARGHASWMASVRSLTHTSAMV